METIRGRQSREMDIFELHSRLEGYSQIQLDLGTGDGRFVCTLGKQHTDRFFIGVDSCRENLRLNSRRELPNALFIISSAQSLPYELHALVSQVSINFPWGSLLDSLLKADVCLLNGLAYVTRPCAAMELRFNADALAAAGWAVEPGADQVESVLNGQGWRTKSRSWLVARDLRGIPTTWSKRLAFGRDPRTIELCFEKG